MGRSIVFAMWVALAAGASVQAAPTVWSGYEIPFAKPSGADHTNPAFQDQITGQVVITRAADKGIFNIAQEAVYSKPVSPAGTEWAFVENNPGASISAANWAALNFNVWRAAHNGNPSGTLGQPAVAHLVDEDIYLDIRFETWGGSGSGGAFSYVRAPEPASLALFGLGSLLMLRRRRHA